MPPGSLSILLHTHMPYVEGFGTWPFGEEWLFEAMASSYLPLLDVLDRAPITLSLTPVLCDQLEAPGVGDRFLRFVRDVRRETHRRDVEGLRAGGEDALAREVERSAAEYEHAAERYAAIDGDLLGALGRHAAWTSSATHAVLPLLATDAGVRLQVENGVRAHRRRFGDWRGGFWLPECAHAPWLDTLLEAAGVHAVCVDLTDVLGRGTVENLRQLRSEDGPLLVPIDRETVELVWSDAGYPAAGAYRDYHARTIHDHRPWANDGSAYDHDAALALTREHARDFVARVVARLAEAAADVEAPLAVCAMDTELLGHWWYEGVAWLAEVVDEAERQGLELAHLDDALQVRAPVTAPELLPVTTWGTPRDLSTWSGPPVAGLAWSAREAELRVVAAGAEAGERAVRELLALQSSDWAFLVARELAGAYPLERAEAHRAALDRALAEGSEPALRSLAPDLSLAPLLAA